MLWEWLIIPINNNSITLKKTLIAINFYLYAKSQFHISLLFWDTAKTLQTCYFGNYGNAWPSPSKIMLSICRKLSCLSACKKSTSLLTYFLRYCKEIANLLYWVIWACLTNIPRIIVSIWINLWHLSAGKKSVSSFTFSLRYCKVLRTCYFGYLGHAWLRTPYVILLNCRRLSCLSAGKK